MMPAAASWIAAASPNDQEYPFARSRTVPNTPGAKAKTDALHFVRGVGSYAVPGRRTRRNRTRSPETSLKSDTVRL
jgi:hypothetical protein